MGIYEPKVIKLNEDVAVTGDRALALFPKDDYEKNKNCIKKSIEEGFKKIDYSGKAFRKDEDTLELTVVPTTRCNLKCKYCYADGGEEKKDTSKEVCFNLIDQLMERYPETSKINLFFTGGGEPLLNFDLIKSVVNYVEDMGLDHYIRIVTNGTKVKDHLEWLKSKNVNLRVSYDGSSQSINRPAKEFDSELRLQETLEALEESYSEGLTRVQMTITKSNVENITEDVLKLIDDYGVISVSLETVHVSGSSRSQNICPPKPSSFSDEMMRLFKNMVEKDKKAYINTIYLNVPSADYICSMRNRLVVSPYGLLSSCVEVIEEGLGDKFIIENKLEEDSNLNFEAIREYQRKNLFSYHPSSYEGCPQCDLVHICRGNCPMRTFFGDRKNSPSSYSCKVAKDLIPRFLEYAADNKEVLNLAFGEEFQKIPININ